MQERDDYADPAPPRKREAELVLALLICAGLMAVAFAGAIALPRLFPHPPVFVS